MIAQKNNITRSVIQWATSFAALDFFLIAVMLLHCFADPSVCGVGTVFFSGIFYTFPFGMIFANSALASGSDFSALSVPALGASTHLIIGVIFGFFRRDVKTSWARSFGVAIAINLLIALISAALYAFVGQS